MPKSSVITNFEKQADELSWQAMDVPSDERKPLLLSAIDYYNKATLNPASHDVLSIHLSVLNCYDNLIAACDGLTPKSRMEKRKFARLMIAKVNEDINLAKINDSYDLFDIHITLFKAHCLLGENKLALKKANEIVQIYPNILKLKSEKLKEDKEKYQETYKSQYFVTYTKDYEVAKEYIEQNSAIVALATQRKRKKKQSSMKQESLQTPQPTSLKETRPKKKIRPISQQNRKQEEIILPEHGQFKLENMAQLPYLDEFEESKDEAVLVEDPWLEEMQTVQTSVKNTPFYKPSTLQTLALAQDETSLKDEKDFRKHKAKLRRDFQKIKKIKQEEIQIFRKQQEIEKLQQEIAAINSDQKAEKQKKEVAIARLQKSEMISVVTRFDITRRRANEVASSFEIPAKSIDKAKIEEIKKEFSNALYQYNDKKYRAALANLYSILESCQKLMISDQENVTIHQKNATLIAVYIHYLLAIISEDKRKEISLSNSDRVDPLRTMLVDDFAYSSYKKHQACHQPSKAEREYAQDLLPEDNLGSLFSVYKKTNNVHGNPFDLHYNVSARIMTEVLTQEQRKLHADNAKKLVNFSPPVKETKNPIFNESATSKKVSHNKLTTSAKDPVGQQFDRYLAQTEPATPKDSKSGTKRELKSVETNVVKKIKTKG